MLDPTPRALLDLDPDLGLLLDPDSLAAAGQELAVAVTKLAIGPWDAATLQNTNAANLGLLLVSGLLAREVLLRDTTSTELLGPGDLVRPWQLEGASRLLEFEVRWNVLAPVEAAVLDRRFAQRLNRYPEIRAVMIDRLNERAQRLAVTQAISHLTGVDLRVEALLWHLADRWGKVTPDGILVPLPLSHRHLGELIGARRPPVSTALARLARERRVVRRPDGWLLIPDHQPNAVPQPPRRAAGPAYIKAA